VKAINQATYLKDLTSISNNLVKSDMLLKLPARLLENSGKPYSVRCLILGARTLGCDVARILMVNTMVVMPLLC
jgi:ubiquitin-like modifier-activating enzyme ATG7